MFEKPSRKTGSLKTLLQWQRSLRSSLNPGVGDINPNSNGPSKKLRGSRNTRAFDRKDKALVETVKGSVKDTGTRSEAEEEYLTVDRKDKTLVETVKGSVKDTGTESEADEFTINTEQSCFQKAKTLVETVKVFVKDTGTESEAEKRF
ncbi:MAG: hypothetical protein Q9170_007141 [Blastenia crenularia]